MKNDVEEETKIVKWVVLLPIFAVVITAIILINIFISSKYEAFNEEVITLEKEHTNKLKQKIQERIEHLSILLNTNFENQVEDSRNTVKNFVYMGHSMLDEIYKNNKDLSKEELYKLIHERMKDVRFFKDKSGYFFIWDLDTGNSISLPSAPSLIGTSLVNLTDKKGKRLFDSYANILEQKGEGFDRWYWNKPGSKTMQEKVGYIKKYNALNIGIGTAIYIDDIKEEISKKSIDFINKLQYSDNSYIFILDKQGTPLLHKNKDIVNVSIENFDEKIQDNINSILEKAKSKNGEFLEYTHSKNLFKNFVPSKKISYVKDISILDWVIGTGLYTDDLNKQITKKKELLEDRLNSDITKLWVVTFLVTLLIIFILIFVSKRIKDLIIYYSKKLNISNNALKKLNKSLEKKVDSQVSHIRQKDLILNQQSKLAAMGEMLGNIAHQWRQPLSAISVLASGIKFKRDMGIPIDEEQLDKDLVNIVNTTKTLSTTIDDFRDFYSNDKEIHEFSIKTLIEQVTNLVLPNLENKNISIISNCEDVIMNSYKNELIQAILNIVNNAKDELESKSYSTYVFINVTVVDENINIEIYDNAGGIKDSIKDQIFEPYFTTKPNGKGTGIGLYMTKKIVDTSLMGKITVDNKSFEYKGEKYKGAVFTIITALNISK